MGRLIVFDGLDASGKNTQSEIIFKSLIANKIDAQILSFPDYSDDSSALVKMYLNGAFGANPAAVNPYAAASFYAADRYASYMRKWKKFYETPGTVVISNRYTTANAIHQMPKLPKSEFASYLDWLWDYEFNKLGIPKPDMVVYFNMHPEAVLKLIENRSELTGQSKDIHESDINHLYSAYNAALFAADHLGWDVIKCSEIHNGIHTPLPREVITNQLSELINSRFPEIFQ